MRPPASEIPWAAAAELSGIQHPPGFHYVAIRSPSRKGRSRSLTIVVLLILALVWAAVLVPPWLRNRADARPADSITAFRHRLNVLERTGPVGAGRASLVSSRPEPAGFGPTRRPTPRVTYSAKLPTQPRPRA